MSGKRVKQFKRITKRQTDRITRQLMDGLLECGFLFRLKIAYQIVKGKKRNEKNKN